jgi:hypothetical protein
MLNALVIVGALISFLNLGDLLLRPQQKEAFHRFIENLTLALDYTRPMIWFARLGERKFAVVWPIISALLVFLADPRIRMIGGTPALLVDLWSNTFRVQTRGLFFLGSNTKFGYAFVAINLLIILTTFWLIGSRVTVFLASGKRIIIFIVRVLAMYAATVVFAFALMAGATYNQTSLSYAIVGVPGLLLLSVPIVIVTIGMLMMSLTLLLFALRLFLKVSRAICWRVVEYSKGAWAAVIAILTAALGIYKAFLS